MRISVSISNALYAAIKSKSRATGASVSFLICRAIEKGGYVPEDVPPEPEIPVWRQMPVHDEIVID